MSTEPADDDKKFPDVLFPDDQDPEKKLSAERSARSAKNAAYHGNRRAKERVWAYLQTDKPQSEVPAIFGKPEDTATVEGTNSAGERVVAVWIGPEGERTEEPEF
jgi:hypothetical protein